MPKNQYVGVSGIARKVKSEYIGVDGVARKVSGGYVGVNGIARQFWPSGIPLSSMPEGSIVKINENGSPVDFYVAKHNYESKLNGNGRTLLQRVSSQGIRQFATKSNRPYVTCFTDSDLCEYLNGTYKASFSAAVQAAMSTTRFKQVSIPSYSIGTGSASIFIPSNAEGGAQVIDGDGNLVGYDGSQLPTWRNFYSGAWTRTIAWANYGSKFYNLNNTYWSTSSQGMEQNNLVIPMFTLPAGTPFDPGTNVILL